ncbi:MAG: HigA family addiction module antidote protein [Rhizorhabdus sp.]|uniref:HigA family addiction module antitoxin n=1 Tax=Rhizorhabdus sp. TaxID=1968843 RepID=UPI001B4E780C|nr:HigA family addiction module antitoxin [Rhizorhabdus sp.]MBP8232131.1 HigA family addiction module antidote protein [Rhizorhabdus sp.]
MAKTQTDPEQLPPIHPGQVLREEFLGPLGISAYALAKAMRVPLNRVDQIVKGRRSISGDTALRLAKCLGTSAEFWARLQADYELQAARAAAGTELDTLKQLVA